jgi:hypothetical protein
MGFTAIIPVLEELSQVPLGLTSPAKWIDLVKHESVSGKVLCSRTFLPSNRIHLIGITT